MQKLNKNYSSIDAMAGQLLQRKTATGRENSSGSEVSFQKILDTAEQSRDAGRLKFSKHANKPQHQFVGDADGAIGKWYNKGTGKGNSRVFGNG